MWVAKLNIALLQLLNFSQSNFMPHSQKIENSLFL